VEEAISELGTAFELGLQKSRDSRGTIFPEARRIDTESSSIAESVQDLKENVENPMGIQQLDARSRREVAGSKAKSMKGRSAGKGVG
jgi:hypothetical protein